VTGKARGRGTPSEIRLNKSLGVALEDVGFAELIYRRALAAKMGRRLAP
jgi:ornithine cyclodeaminase/alanine dehydrogenase-like protein (mu-crystallin family)